MRKKKQRDNHRSGLACRRIEGDHFVGKKADLTNVTLTNNLIADMNQRYANAHCTIIPYTKPDDYLKLIPNSALESLVRRKTGCWYRRRPDWLNLSKTIDAALFLTRTSKAWKKLSLN